MDDYYLLWPWLISSKRVLRSLELQSDGGFYISDSELNYRGQPPIRPGLRAFSVLHKRAAPMVKVLEGESLSVDFVAPRPVSTHVVKPKGILVFMTLGN